MHGAGQLPPVSSYLAQRTLGNLGQLNPIPETKLGAADSGVTHPAGENDLVGIKGHDTKKGLVYALKWGLNTLICTVIIVVFKQCKLPFLEYQLHFIRGSPCFKPEQET